MKTDFFLLLFPVAFGQLFLVCYAGICCRKVAGLHARVENTVAADVLLRLKLELNLLICSERSTAASFFPFDSILVQFPLRVETSMKWYARPA